MGSNLNDLYLGLVEQNNALVSDFEAPLPSDPEESRICAPIHGFGKSMLVVRLQHYWGEFCRDLVLLSAVGSPKTFNERILEPVAIISKIEDIPAAIGFEISGPRAAWHIPDFAISVATKLGVANIEKVQQGLATVSPLRNLLSVRNYIVHPNDDNKTRYGKVARDWGALGSEPEAFLAERLMGGATIFESWARELEVLAFNAVQ